jgi:nucleoside 2-deoxyribosyltransferase
LEITLTIYFSGSIAGGRAYLDTYEKIVAYLKKLGHRVPSEHIIHPDVLKRENVFSPEDIYTRDVEWIKESDVVIAEVSNPSLGVGYEISYALRLKKPVLCLFKKGLFISRMITGNTSPGINVIEYTTAEDWKNSITEFLALQRNNQTPH